MSHEPCWSRYAAERPAQDGFLWTREHQRVMDNAISRLDVVEVMSWERTPGSGAQGEACTRPVIDAHSTVAQVCNCSLHCCCDRRILERARMDKDGGIECSPDVLIGKGNGIVNVFSNVCRIKCSLGKEAAERFRAKAHIICVLWINACNQCPGEVLTLRRSKLLRFWMSCDKGVLSLFRPWIIGVAGRYLGQYPAYPTQELIALCPPRVLKDDPGGITIKAGIVGEHRSDMFGVVRKIADAPWAGDDDDRADIS